MDQPVSWVVVITGVDAGDVRSAQCQFQSSRRHDTRHDESPLTGATSRDHDSHGQSVAHRRPRGPIHHTPQLDGRHSRLGAGSDRAGVNRQSQTDRRCQRHAATTMCRPSVFVSDQS